MKASDLKALLSFAPLALLEPLFERRGEELDSAPLESPSSLSPPLSLPIFVMGHSSAFGAPRFYCSCDHSRRRTTPQSTCPPCQANQQ